MAESLKLINDLIVYSARGGKKETFKKGTEVTAKDIGEGIFKKLEQSSLYADQVLAQDEEFVKAEKQVELDAEKSDKEPDFNEDETPVEAKDDFSEFETKEEDSKEDSKEKTKEENSKKKVAKKKATKKKEK